MPGLVHTSEMAGTEREGEIPSFEGHFKKLTIEAICINGYLLRPASQIQPGQSKYGTGQCFSKWNSLSIPNGDIFLGGTSIPQ